MLVLLGLDAFGAFLEGAEERVLVDVELLGVGVRVVEQLAHVVHVKAKWNEQRLLRAGRPETSGQDAGRAAQHPRVVLHCAVLQEHGLM